MCIELAFFMIGGKRNDTRLGRKERERSIKVVKFFISHKEKERNGKLGLRIKRKMANQPADTSVEKSEMFLFYCLF